MRDLDAILSEALAAFAAVDDPDALERVKARFLGKTGALTELLKGLGKLPAAERPAAGSRINDAKQKLEAALAASLDPSRVSTDARIRLRHGHGHTQEDMWAIKYGMLRRAPDVVVWPESADEVRALLQLCAAHGACVALT